MSTTTPNGKRNRPSDELTCPNGEPWCPVENADGQGRLCCWNCWQDLGGDAA